MLTVLTVCLGTSVFAAGGTGNVGDLDGNGQVEAADRMILARFIAGWDEYSDIDTDAADIDGNGKVTPKDRMILSRYIDGWAGYDEYFASSVTDPDAPIELPDDVFGE